VFVVKVFYVFSTKLGITEGIIMGKTVKLQKHGQSGRYSITLPKSMIETKSWEQGDEIEIDEISTNELRLTKQ